jgi:hypothetical protein
MSPQGNEFEASHNIWSARPYPIESGVAPEGGGEGRGEVHQVLLEPEPELEHVGPLEQIPQRRPQVGERHGEEVDDEHLAALALASVAAAAGHLEECDRGELRRRWRRRGAVASASSGGAAAAARLPLGVEGDDAGGGEGAEEEGEPRRGPAAADEVHGEWGRWRRRGVHRCGRRKGSTHDDSTRPMGPRVYVAAVVYEFRSGPTILFAKVW